MQILKNHQVPFAVLALCASANSSPAQPRHALADIHVRSMNEGDIPVVDSRVPLKLRSNFADRSQGQNIKRQSGPLRTIYDGQQYAIDLTVGTEILEVLIDTGSSSFWVPKADFVCVDKANKVLPQSACGFPKYGPKDFSAGQISDENFNVTYGGGEFATGLVGLESIGFGGVTVKNQKIGFVDRTHWESAGNLTSGLMGWGLGANTAFYPGSDPSQNDGEKALTVKPWLVSAYEQGLVAKPIFSVVLGKRGKQDQDLEATGFLTIGGAPPPSTLPLTGVYATTPILRETFPHFQLKDEYAHYTIRPDGFVVNGKLLPWEPENWPGTSEEIITILDTGTPLTYLPKPTVDAIASAFDSPASFSEDDGVFLAPCGAKVPSVAIRINGTDVPFAPSDILLDGDQGVWDEQKQTCLLGFQYPLTPPWDGALPYLLGANFYRNVLAVHDIGNKRMTFGALKWT